jgi:hypothetical protein
MSGEMISQRLFMSSLVKTTMLDYASLETSNSKSVAFPLPFLLRKPFTRL